MGVFGVNINADECKKTMFLSSPLLSSPLLSSPLLLLTRLHSLLRKPINLQAELRACVLFLFIRGSGHMSVCLPVFWPWPLKMCLLCTCMCPFTFVCMYLHTIRLIQDLTQPMTALMLSQTPWPTTGELAGAWGACLTALNKLHLDDGWVDWCLCNCAVSSSSLKKSSAELKRILTNGQVSVCFGYKLFLTTVILLVLLTDENAFTQVVGSIDFMRCQLKACYTDSVFGYRLFTLLTGSGRSEGSWELACNSHVIHTHTHTHTHTQ